MMAQPRCRSSAAAAVRQPEPASCQERAPGVGPDIALRNHLSELAIENETVPVRIPEAKLPSPARRIAHLHTHIHNSIRREFCEERIRIVDVDAKPQSPCSSAFELVRMLPLHVQMHIIAEHARVVVGLVGVPKVQLKPKPFNVETESILHVVNIENGNCVPECRRCHMS